MNDKIKQAFEECEKFIDEHTPEELREYEKSLNLDYEWYYGTPEQENKNTGVKYGYNDAPIEDVYNIHYDTAGNFRWTGTKSMDKMGRNEKVSMEILDRLCSHFSCDISDIIEHVDEVEK